MTARVEPVGAHELDRRGATPLWVQLLADLRRRLGAGEFSAAFPGELKRVEISGSHGTAVLREEDIITWKFAEQTKEDEALLARMANKTQTGGGAADPAAGAHDPDSAEL